jgi:hypothetical protein
MAWENFSLAFVSKYLAKPVRLRGSHGLCELLLGEELVAFGFECVRHDEECASSLGVGYHCEMVVANSRARLGIIK